MNKTKYQTPEEQAALREHRIACASLVTASESWISLLQGALDPSNATYEEDMAFVICDMKAEAKKLEQMMRVIGNLSASSQWTGSAQ